MLTIKKRAIRAVKEGAHFILFMPSKGNSLLNSIEKEISEAETEALKVALKLITPNRDDCSCCGLNGGWHEDGCAYIRLQNRAIAIQVLIKTSNEKI